MCKAMAKKVDQHQAEIVEALRQVGALVWCVNGVFDLVVVFRGCVRILEVKEPGGRLTLTQRDWLVLGWPAIIVHSIDEALWAIGAIA